MHIPEKVGPFILPIKKIGANQNNWVSNILFVEKRGTNHISGSVEMGGNLACTFSQ